MAWTAPRTWVTAETVTAALMNTHIRDNLLETSAATATTAGDLVYADAANSMGSRVGISSPGGILVSTGSVPVWRIPIEDGLAGSSTGITNTGYFNLISLGFVSAIEASVVSGTACLVILYANMSNANGANATIMSYGISGATTVSPSDSWALEYVSSNAGDAISYGSTFLHTGLTAGTNLFTLYARVSGGTGTIQKPRIAVVPL